MRRKYRRHARLSVFAPTPTPARGCAVRACQPLRWVAALVVGLVPLVGAGPAVAAGGDGFWWYDAVGVPQVQAAGVTGAGVKVAVIGEGIDPQVPMLAGAHVTVHEPSFCRADDGTGPNLAASSPVPTRTVWHDTNVVALIAGTGSGQGGARSVAGIAPGASVTFYSIGSPAADTRFSGCKVGTGMPLPYSEAIVTAVNDGARIIAVPLGSASATLALKGAVAWAVHQGVVMVVGLGDMKTDPDDWALMNGVVAVQAADSNLNPIGKGTAAGVVPHAKVTVVGPGVGIFTQGSSVTKSWQASALGDGTSLATPLVAGMLADVASKYPKATGNQLIQTLINNTGKDAHTLGYDPVFGYGVANLRHMLAVDPTTYPDVNPLIVKDARDFTDNSAVDIANATYPTIIGVPDPSPSASATASAAPSPAAAPVPGSVSSVGRPGWVWPAGVLLLVLVLVLVLVSTARRRRTAPPTPGPSW